MAYHHTPTGHTPAILDATYARWTQSRGPRDVVRVVAIYQATGWARVRRHDGRSGLVSLSTLSHWHLVSRPVA